MDARTRRIIALDERYCPPNYAPLPVAIARGSGVMVTDVTGKRYFDMLSAYSALNQGHNHPAIVRAARDQMGKLCLTSRAYHNERLGPFLERLCTLLGVEQALPMNSGAEAVETAIKAMRLWGYERKKIPAGKAEILVAENNFHGRTTTIVSFSTHAPSREPFRPGTPGFRILPYGDAAAFERAMTKNVCGVLIEPIQGEAGVRIPQPGFLKALERACRRRKVLLCVDEIQTGLGRTGRLLCSDHEDVKADLYCLGKALSGGLYPISAVVGTKASLGLFRPGMHGSTFGGNPLAAAIGRAALDVIVKERLPQRAAEHGEYFLEKLATLEHPLLHEVRGLGLLLAVEFRRPVAKDFCKLLMKRGLLAKDTHGTTVRFAPPLIITKPQIDRAFRIIRDALADL